MIRVDGKVAFLPQEGTLIVCSDLQGNLDDFIKMETRFRKIHEDTGNGYLLFLGDLIHGHHGYTSETWPDWLGPHYEDRSTEIMERYLDLEERFPGRVLSLLGNHEHSHIGGIWLENYSDRFEEMAGDRLEVFCSAFRRLPVIAIAPCGIVFSHACPSLRGEYSACDIAGIEHNKDFSDLSVAQMTENEPLGTLIWSRVASREEANRFLDGLSDENVRCNISVCGHDPVDEGFDKAEENQLVLSTSYRMQPENKTFLRVDLGALYRSVADLGEGYELLALE